MWGDCQYWTLWRLKSKSNSSSTVTQLIYSDISSVKVTFTASIDFIYYKIFFVFVCMSFVFVHCGLMVRLQNALAESKEHEGKYEESHPNLRKLDTSGKSFFFLFEVAVWFCWCANTDIIAALSLIKSFELFVLNYLDIWNGSFSRWYSLLKCHVYLSVWIYSTSHYVKYHLPYST